MKSRDCSPTSRTVRVENATTTARMLPAMITTAAHTGMRKGELFGLRKTDVHLDAGRIDVMRSSIVFFRSRASRATCRSIPSWRACCGRGSANAVQRAKTGSYFRLTDGWEIASKGSD